MLNIIFNVFDKVDFRIFFLGTSYSEKVISREMLSGCTFYTAHKNRDEVKPFIEAPFMFVLVESLRIAENPKQLLIVVLFVCFRVL